jgi:hypothetical protein
VSFTAPVKTALCKSGPFCTISASRLLTVKVRPSRSDVTSTPFPNFVRPSGYVNWEPNLTAKATRPSLKDSKCPPVGFSTIASGSLRSGAAPVWGTPFRSRSATTTTATKMMTNAAIAKRAFFCQVMSNSFQLSAFSFQPSAGSVQLSAYSPSSPFTSATFSSR